MRIIKVLLTLCAVFSASVLFAQSQTEFWLSSEFYKSNKVDFKGADNSIDISGGSVHLGMIRVNPDEDMLVLDLSAGRLRYEFDESNPWRSSTAKDCEDINELDLLGLYERNISADWSLLTVSYFGSAYSVEDSSFSDGLVWMLGAGAKYKVSEDLKYVLGVIYYHGQEGRNVVVPLFGVEWQITDKLYLDGLMGLTLSYDFLGDGSSVLAMGVEYQLRDFAMGDKANDGLDASVRPEGAAFFAAYTQALTESISITAKISAYDSQEYKTVRDDKTFSRFETKESVFAGIGLDIRF